MRFFILVISLLVATSTFAKPFVGAMTSEQLLASEPNFAQSYADYRPNVQDLELIKKLAGKEVLVLFGTWCHDSEREVGRFLKLLDQSGVKLSALQLIAVDYDKKDPMGIAEAHDLKYTPTIIVTAHGKEIVRMVEKPQLSLAADLTAAL